MVPPFESPRSIRRRIRGVEWINRRSRGGAGAVDLPGARTLGRGAWSLVAESLPMSLPPTAPRSWRRPARSRWRARPTPMCAATPAKFYEWLEARPAGEPARRAADLDLRRLPSRQPRARSPTPTAGSTVQIRDLDQTVIGNPAHDLIRLGLSLATAARGSDLPGVTTARMIEQMVEGYEAALAGDPGARRRSATSPTAVRTRAAAGAAAAAGGTWPRAARRRQARPSRSASKFWPLDDEERAALDGAVRRTTRCASLVTAPAAAAPTTTPIELLDAAYWMKGCSSLGRLRYARAGRRSAKGAGRELCLVDIKEAVGRRRAAPRQARRCRATTPSAWWPAPARCRPISASA